MEKINYIVFDGSAKDCYQAIDKCVEKLVEYNITDMEFSRYCKEREKKNIQQDYLHLYLLQFHMHHMIISKILAYVL